MISEFETKLLGIMMIVIMLGMGASLTWRDFRIAFRKPKGVLVGLFCQYGIMPLLGFVLAKALGLSQGLTVGLILMACMPGGTTSNIFTYFSKAVLALSIMMTSVSSLIALGMVPALLEFYSQLAGLSGDFKIPAGNVAQVLFVLLVPTVLGMVLRKLNPNIGATVELLGGMLGVAVILFLVFTWIPRNHMLLAGTPWYVFFAAIGLGIFGMGLGEGVVHAALGVLRAHHEKVPGLHEAHRGRVMRGGEDAAEHLVGHGRGQKLPAHVAA